MNDSEIKIAEGGAVVYSGPDATSLFRAKVMKEALAMYNRTGMKANRMYTPAAMCMVVSAYTDKPYNSRSKASREQAVKDLEKWISTMECAMPITDERKPKA